MTRVGAMLPLFVLALAFFGSTGSSSKADVYMVLMEGDPTSRYYGGLLEFEATACEAGTKFDKSRQSVHLYASHLIAQHDNLLKQTLVGTTYNKLYSYHHLLNGFAVHATANQADLLANAPGVMLVEKSWRVNKLTTHTPEFLGLPDGVWAKQGGSENAGEGIVIGIIDTGIDPTHPSFSGDGYGPVKGYKAYCEEPVDKSLPKFCNGKIVGAQHFVAAALAAGNFNASVDYDSPLDGDGHGSHIASVAAGNYGVPVVVNGNNYGNASGMAPRARIAVYKALYRQFGGFVADVVAAIDKAVEDGVDVLNLSVGPNSPPSSSAATFLNVFDMALLGAVKQGVFVVQAAGNGGPYPRTIVSFSPWITTVAAGIDDRSYPNLITLGNQKSLPGVGLAPPSPGNQTYELILAKDAVGNNSNFFFSPNDCQDPSLFNPEAVRGRILICTYSFSFIFGGATLKQVAATVSNLSAIGFVLIVESDLAGSKFQPVPLSVPGIVITSLESSQELLRYYNASTSRGEKGRATQFNATAKIADGQKAVFNHSAPQVASFSSRGPDVRDFAFQDADVLKPNILAPGSLIWGAWTPTGTDEPNFEGKSFALMSGTSMATPHVAGIAALLKKKFPNKSPAAISSAMMTTASVLDKSGSPLLAQHVSVAGRGGSSSDSSSSSSTFGPATPFDYGHGAINPTAALDPGLVFDAGYDDYVNFLCAVPGVKAKLVTNSSFSCLQEHHHSTNHKNSNSSRTTRTKTKQKFMTDLNLPSITIASLDEERRVRRTVTSVADGAETYTISYVEPASVAVAVSPTSLSLQREGDQASFTVVLKPVAPTSEFGFGELKLVGDCGHSVRVPISVLKVLPPSNKSR